MRIWKNTNTLDALCPELRTVCQPEEAEVAVLGSKAIDLAQFPKLRLLFKCGVGTDNVPFEACAARGIRIGLPSEQTASVIRDETAAFAVGLIYRMLFAEVGSLDSWTKVERPYIRNRKVLVLGTGNIGSRVAAGLRGVVEVLTYDERTYRPGDLADLLRSCDGLTIHLPLTPQTRHLLNADTLSLLKDGAFIVNTARGPIVEESALLSEIRSGRLRAAFDVFWQEPYHGPLRAYHPDRFFMTPHVASTNDAFLRSLAADFSTFWNSPSA
jgi:phosphoglycerate dehydrogenase-like enzyme